MLPNDLRTWARTSDAAEIVVAQIKVATRNSDRDVVRRVIADHLRVIGDRYRAFVVTFDRYERTVAAASASKARYSYYLDVSDAMPDLKFKDFCRRTKVRAA